MRGLPRQALGRAPRLLRVGNYSSLSRPCPDLLDGADVRDLVRVAAPRTAPLVFYLPLFWGMGQN